MHLSSIDTMMDNLRLGILGLPPAVLEPLAKVKAHAAAQEHELFNQPQQHLQAFTEALEANDACYALLATGEAWSSVDGDDAVVGAHMRAAAEWCANEGRSKEAAALFILAVKRAGVHKQHRDRVGQVLSAEGNSVAEVRPALEAASMLLTDHGMSGKWVAATLNELCTHADRHTVGRLAASFHLAHDVFWPTQPLAEYPDLPIDGYKAQDVFHRIDTRYPGLQVISQDPYIIIRPNFLSSEECKTYINAFAVSA